VILSITEVIRHIQQRNSFVERAKPFVADHRVFKDKEVWRHHLALSQRPGGPELEAQFGRVRRVGVSEHLCRELASELLGAKLSATELEARLAALEAGYLASLKRAARAKIFENEVARKAL